MVSVKSVSDAVNYKIAVADQTVKKIAANPFAVTTILKIARKIFAGFDLYSIGEVRQRGLIDAMTGTIQIYEFYSTYQNILFWIRPWSKNSLDEKALKNSLRSELEAAELDNLGLMKPKKIAKSVFKEVMDEKSYHCKSEVFKKIKFGLENRGLSSAKVDKICKGVVIRQTKRSIVQYIYMTCFTVTDFADNLFALQKWKIIDVSRWIAAIGCQWQVCKYAMGLNVGTVLGSLGSVGLTFAVGNSTYRTIDQRVKCFRAKNEKEKQAAIDEFRNARLDLLSGGVDLVTTALPLFHKFSPSALVAMDLLSNGMGLVYIMLHD